MSSTAIGRTPITTAISSSRRSTRICHSTSSSAGRSPATNSSPAISNAIAATGFLVAGSYPGQTTAKTLALIRYDHLDDMVSTLGTSMLGLSLGCARCHEHKYDPIPQEDYYRLVAALGRTDSANLKVNTDPAEI